MTAPPPTPSPAVIVWTGALFRKLALSALVYSPPSAVFLAERARALEPLSEQTACLLAQCYLAADSPHEALWLLRQPVSFAPIPTSSRSGEGATAAWPQATTSSGRLILPAMECSIRCARLYGEACRALRRDQEGRQILTQISRPGAVLAPALPLDEPAAADFPRFDEVTAVQLEIGRLARRAGERERAVASFARVVANVPTCWEAIEALCALGCPPDVDKILPAVESAPAPGPSQVASSARLPETVPAPVSQPVHSPSPLTPSQTVILNAPAEYIHAARFRNESVGLFTPVENAGKAGDFADLPNKGKAKDTAALPPPLRRAPVGRGPIYTATPVQDDSFDSTFYPTTGTISFAPVAAAGTGAQAGAVPSSGAPVHASRLPPAASGVKRTRAGTLAPASAHLANSSGQREDDRARTSTAARRLARGEGKPRRADLPAAPNAPATRRSTRLSSALPPQSATMAISRSQTGVGSKAPGAKKRSKAGGGPSVLSDNSSDAMHSLSSSPVPPSPGQSNGGPTLGQLGEATAQLEAECYVAHVLRHFALAAVAQSQRAHAAVAEALAGLPVEQARSPLASCISAQSCFDAMQYAKASKFFERLREEAPHRLEGMDTYSTTLWHLRDSTKLAFLAQELLAGHSKHPAAWIASGNVFSNVEDHTAALRSFRRAAQLDEECANAYTLSGHECVVLEEWERALGFFREAIRRDPRYYTAWFGLGNVYLKTGKPTLAEYHFRKALDLNPANATLACCVGAVLETLGRRTDALAMYDHAKTVAPQSSLVRFKRVRLLIRMHQDEAAEADLLALQHQAANEPNVLYLLGQLYRNLGRRPEMLRFFAQAQDLEPRMAGLVRQQIQQDGASEMEVDEEMSETGSRVEG